MAALEHMVANLYVAQYRNSGLSADRIRQHHADVLQTLAASTLPGEDPAVADATVDEITQFVRRLLSIIEVDGGSGETCRLAASRREVIILPLLSDFFALRSATMSLCCFGLV